MEDDIRLMTHQPALHISSSSFGRILCSCVIEHFQIILEVRLVLRGKELDGFLAASSPFVESTLNLERMIRLQL